jgi:HSP20 family protein
MADTATKLPVKTETGPVESAAARLWSPIETLRGEMDRLFDMFGGRSRGALSRPSFALDFGFPRDMMFGAGVPAVDVAEKDKEYEITAELPGLDDRDVEVKVADGILTIKGEKKEEKEERQKDYYLSERRYGSFVRSFAVPKGVDPDGIAARFSKGLLTVTLPKTPGAKAEEKKIEVKAA